MIIVCETCSNAFDEIIHYIPFKNAHVFAFALSLVCLRFCYQPLNLAVAAFVSPLRCLSSEIKYLKLTNPFE